MSSSKLIAAIYGFCIESAEDREEFIASLYAEPEVVTKEEEQERKREAIARLGGTVG